MYAELEDWNNGWWGLRLGVRPEEIEQLIALLRRLQGDPEQHFHLSSRDNSGPGGVGDIEISVASYEEPDNIQIGSLAIGPGAVFPQGKA